MGRILTPILFIIVIQYLSIDSTHSQTVDEAMIEQIQAVLIMDSITIRASSTDVSSFIRRSMEDSTFYSAFKNLRTANYDFESNLLFYSKRGETKTTYYSLRRQEILDSLRQNTILKETVHPKYYKRNGEFRYYTAVLYNRLFLTPSPTPVYIDNSKGEESSTSRMEGYIESLKRLIFMPGHEVNIPLTKDKFTIFSAPLKDYYDYILYVDTLEQGREVYTFHVKPKVDCPFNQIAIHSLKTHFDKKNYQIMGREIELKDKTLLYSYDVKMKINITEHQNKYYPSRISYHGQWNIPLKTAEISDFYFNIVGF
ncbi:hypothetical protein [Membranihabitans marinus]|uniref:hypothetical protein n=1 Tax=Membranihabitans marinus TaxID=1227546 RepID=UPI001F17C7EE|nr:hypothetical protein [Membranihabitans marinus]